MSITCGAKWHRHRGKQAALERCQVRSKDDAVDKAQNLLDLGRMTMFAHAVGLQVFVCTAKVGAGVAGLAGARHTADGVDDHGAALGNPIGTHSRRGGKARRRRVTTGAGDKHGLTGGMVGCGGLQILGEQLGQTESAGLEQLGARVLGGIPGLKGGWIAQAIIGREVNAGDSRGKQGGHLSHGSRVRHGNKNTASQFLSSGASCVVKTRSLTPVKLGYTADNGWPASALDVMATSSNSGWPSTRRMSSAPAYPAAPTIPTFKDISDSLSAIYAPMRISQRSL